MNPRTAMDCIACAVMPTAVWLIPVARQNRITRSCAVSFVVAFARPTPCIGLPAMRQGAAVAASVASVAAASVALAAAWRQPIPAYGRPGGGVSRSYTDLPPAVLVDSPSEAAPTAPAHPMKQIRQYV